MSEIDLTSGAMILGMVLGTLMIVCAAFVYVVERKLERPGMLLVAVGALVLGTTVWQSSSLEAAKIAAEDSQKASDVVAEKSQASQQVNASKLSEIKGSVAKLYNNLAVMDQKSGAAEKRLAALDKRSANLGKRTMTLESQAKKTYKEVQASIKKNVSSNVKSSEKKAVALIEQQSQHFASKILAVEENLAAATERIAELESANEALRKAQQVIAVQSAADALPATATQESQTIAGTPSVID